MDNEGAAPGRERCSVTMRGLSQGIAGRRAAAGMHAAAPRNGRAFSGNFSRCMEASKQSPKSMCSSLPLYLSSMRLLGCLSPSPSR